MRQIGVIHTSSSLLTEAYIENYEDPFHLKKLSIFVRKLDSEHQKAVIKNTILLNCCMLAQFLSSGLDPLEMKAVQLLLTPL